MNAVLQCHPDLAQRHARSGQLPFIAHLAGGGKPSGPLSFMRVYDQIAAVVKSGGKTRRAAKMQSIKVWHPDVMEFIECKWKEEQKAHCLIEKGGYEANFNGEAIVEVNNSNPSLFNDPEINKAMVIG